MVKSECQQLQPEIDQVDPEKFSAPTEELQEPVFLDIFRINLFKSFCGFLIQRIPDSFEMCIFLKAFEKDQPSNDSKKILQTFQGLFQIRDQILRRFNSHGESNHLRTCPGGKSLFIAELPVGGRSRMENQ